MPELCQAKSRSDPASLPQNKRRGCPKSRKVSVARHRLALRYPIEYVPFRDLSDDLSDIPLRVYGDFPHPEDHFTPSGKSSTPSGNLSTPSGKSFTPSGKSSTPSGKPSTPSGKSSTPSGKPSTSSGKRFTPSRKSS